MEFNYSLEKGCLKIYAVGSVFMSRLDVFAGKDACFYVKEDLRDVGCVGERFEGFMEAWGYFSAVRCNERAWPALGIERGLRGVDLVHRVDGKCVMVREYQEPWMAPELQAMRPVCERIEKHLIETGLVTHCYCRDLFVRGLPAPVVVVPAVPDGMEFDDFACNDKRLKTVGGGLDSVNQLLVEGYGWVDYQDLLEAPREFCQGRILHVDGVNVNYNLKDSYMGVDGRMDVSVQMFLRMLEDVQKEFQLVVFDNCLEQNFVVNSFDKESEAVRAWYDLGEVALDETVSAFVMQRVRGYSKVVFNGLDDELKEIPFEQAARMYGFTTRGLGKERGMVVDEILHNAKQRFVGQSRVVAQDKGMEQH